MEAGSAVALSKKIAKKFSAKPKKNCLPGKSLLPWSDPKKAKKINQKYRNKNKPATVLSFVYPKKSGEIILAIPEIKKRSKAEKRNFADVFSHLLIHGLLHILGYCHDSRQSARKMEELEKSLVKDL